MTTFFAPEQYVTRDFTLRSYEPGDGPATCEAKAGSYEHLQPWMPWASTEETEESNEVLVRMFRANWLLNTDFVMGVWSPDGGRLLGGSGIHLRGGSLESGVGEIGMWIRADQAGRGLGTAVLRAVLDWGFSNQWPWERLSWHCDSRNVASRRVAEKAGMRLEGTLRGDKAEVGEGRRDTLIFGLTRSDRRG